MLEYISGIVNIFSLWDRFKNRLIPSPVVTNTAQRFIRLFEAHGISRAQIPRFFGHNLTIHQVEDETELSKILDTNLLEAVATLFGIRLEWLEGGTDALILMREKIGELADENIYRYYFCEQWIYGYWKCRTDIAACVAQGWKRNQYITGRMLTQKVFNKIISLKFVPDSELEGTVIANQRFHAEDLTLNPKFFVQGLSEGQLGIENAVTLWLEYQQLGFMDSGFGNKRSVFEQFQHDHFK